MIALKKNFYLVCLLSFLFNPLQISLSALCLFEQSSYQPTLELNLKGGNQRTLGRAGAMIPLQASDKGLWFTQVWGLWDSNAAKEWNVGLGYRYQLAHWIVGSYGFFDRRFSTLNHRYSQMTFGIELLGEMLEYRLNGYIPTTSARAVNFNSANKANIVSLVFTDGLEKPLGGVDVEVGGHLPYHESLQGFLTYYHFNGSGVKAIDGVRLRGQLHLTNYISVTGETSYDRVRKRSWLIGMQLRFKWGTSEKKTGLSKKMIQMIVRDVDVVTHYIKAISTASHLMLKRSPDANAYFTSLPLMLRITQDVLLISPKPVHLSPPEPLFMATPTYKTYIPLPHRSNIFSYLTHHNYWKICSIRKYYSTKIPTKRLENDDKEQANYSDNWLKLLRVVNRPNDYMHGLIAQDTYRNSEAINSADTVTLNGEQWEVKFTQSGKDGYFGALYFNPVTKRLVLAYQGAKPSVNWKNSLDNIVEHMELKKLEAYKLLKESVILAQEKGYGLSVTGHSLGGGLAELSVFVGKNILDYPSISAVTFDSPGIIDFIKKYYSNDILRYNGNLAHASYDVIGYVSYPNIINVANKHLGSLYMLPVQLEIDNNIWSKLVHKSESLSNYYQVFLYSLKALLIAFEKQAVAPRRQYMLAYPLMAREPKWWPHIEQLYTTETKEIKESLDTRSKQHLTVFKYNKKGPINNKNYTTYELPSKSLEDIENALESLYGAEFKIDKVLSDPHTFPLRHFEPALRDYLKKFWEIYENILMRPSAKKKLKETWENKQIPPSLIELLTNFQLSEHQNMNIIITEIDNSEVFKQQLSQALVQYSEQAQALLLDSSYATIEAPEPFKVANQNTKR